MLLLKSVIGRLNIWFCGFLLTCNVFTVLGPTCVGSSQAEHPSRFRREMRVDTYPGPGASEPDKFTNRVLHWHVMYCGKNRVCVDHMTSSCYMCAPCQCDLACGTYGDCCPDLAMEAGGDDLQRPFTGIDYNVWSCRSTAIKKSLPEYSNLNNARKVFRKRQGDVKIQFTNDHEMKTQNYLMISSCPQTFTADTSLCDNSEDLAPVSTTDSSLKVYKNVHCAQCHDALEISSWIVRISCVSGKNLSNLFTARDAVATLMSQEDCSVAYAPPSPEVGRKCYSEPEMITRCNVTGKWTKRDSFLERACHIYLTPKFVNEILYRNVFCFMCNHGDEPEAQMLLKSCQKKPMTWTPSIEVTMRDLDLSKPLADVRPFGKMSHTVCRKRGIYDDIEESCRQVSCEDGQQLVNGVCQPIFSTVRGIGYELYFGLRPTAPVDVSGDHSILHRLPAEMEVYLGQSMLQGKVKLQDFAMSFNTTDVDGRCSQTSSDLGVYARLVTNVVADQAQLQSDFLQLRYGIFNLTVQTWIMFFQGFPNEAVWHTMQPTRRQSPQQLSACVIIVSNTRLEQRKDGTMRVGTTTPDPVSSTESNQPSFIRLSDLLNCPRVQLMPHEYSSTSPGNALTLKWGPVLPSNRFIMDLEGNVTICLPDFLYKLEKNRIPRSAQEETLAIVLLTVSILCLFLSFLVFLLFTVLRSLPGKNNMVLVICLCFSQISILIGHLVDDTSRVCSLLGVATHYFTLSVFCSLIASSYHVYTIFTTMHLSRDITRDLKSLVSYCCFTFLVPIAIVAAVIAMHASHKLSWRTFGYGGGPFCLLSSAISLWVALFLPIVLSLIVVFVLFCLTFTSLHHAKDLETNQTDERHVNFYFRATLLASVTWFIGVPGIVTSLSPLRIIFISLQSLLGIYVFVSLVLTPRVARLLSGSCCQSRQPPRGRTSLNMKMASSDDCPVKPPCILGTGYRRRDPTFFGSDSRRHPQEIYTKNIDFIETTA